MNVDMFILLSFQGILCNRYKLGTCLRGHSKEIETGIRNKQKTEVK